MSGGKGDREEIVKGSVRKSTALGGFWVEERRERSEEKRVDRRTYDIEKVKQQLDCRWSVHRGARKKSAKERAGMAGEEEKERRREGENALPTRSCGCVDRLFLPPQKMYSAAEQSRLVFE